MSNLEQQSSAEALKGFFRNHASGVAIITTLSQAGEPLGFTATSLTSLGTNPPLVSFNVAQGASFYSALRTGVRVNLHALGVDNLQLAQRLAGPREQRFLDDDWQIDDSATPRLNDVVALLSCEILQVVEIEKNAVVIAQALAGEVLRPGVPLLYHQRAFVAGGAVLASNTRE